MDLNQILKQLYLQIEETLENPHAYGARYALSYEEAQAELKDMTLVKDRAALGDRQARLYLINQYAKWLAAYFQRIPEELDRLVSLQPESPPLPRVLFEMLLEQHDLSWLIDQYGWEIQVTALDLAAVYQAEFKELAAAYQPFINRVRLIATLIYTFEDGQDALDSLQHHQINEIGVLSADYIYVVYRGKKLRLSFLSLPDTSTVINIQKKTTRNSKFQFDEQNPTVVASKNNANRITVAGYSATATAQDVFYNERIFNLKKITLEELRDQYQTLNQLIYQLILLNQRGRGSYLVSGSDMGVGKSTFLSATIEKVPDYWGIGILDSQDELQIRKKYPWKNVITLIENPKRGIDEQFQIMLKMARDVLYVGEITKPEEISQMLNSSLRLNAGVGATIHLISPFEAVANCRNLLMGTPMYDQSQKAEEDVARGINLVFHLNKLPEGRIILERVVEICYLEIDQQTDRLMAEQPTPTTLMKLAQLALGKYLSQRCYRYNELIAYDYDTHTWQAVNLPSQAYWEKIGKYVPKQELDQWISDFQSLQREGR